MSISNKTLVSAATLAAAACLAVIGAAGAQAATPAPSDETRAERVSTLAQAESTEQRKTGQFRVAGNCDPRFAGSDSD